MLKFISNPAKCLFNLAYRKSSRPAELKGIKAELDGWRRLSKVKINCGNVDKWHSYFDERIGDLPNLIERLKCNTDSESREQLDLFFERYRRVFPPSRFSGRVFFLPDAILTPRELAEAEKLEEFNRNPLPYLFPPGVQNEEPHLFWTECGLVHVPEEERLRVRGGDVIDGGAFCGDSAMVFNKYSPSRIHCFEVLPENISLLEKTAKINGVENVIQPVRMGLGSKAGKLGLVRRKEALHAMDALLQPFDQMIPEGWEAVCDVGICSVDEYVDANSLKPALIKLDVEGSEFDVISGALKTIERFRPLLLISVYHNPRDFFEIKPMVERANPNYRFKFRYLCPVTPSHEFSMIAY